MAKAKKKEFKVPAIFEDTDTHLLKIRKQLDPFELSNPKYDYYELQIQLLTSILATNPINPNVHEKHIIEKQRKLITDNCDVNKELNKYQDALPIPDAVSKLECNSIIDKLEKLTGTIYSAEDRAKMIEGKLEGLKETLREYELEGATVFFWNKELDLPMLGTQMISGFLKKASEVLMRLDTTKKKDGKVWHTQATGNLAGSHSFTKKNLNDCVGYVHHFMFFDRNVITKEDGSPLYQQRSLRIDGKDPRVTLAKSEEVEKGARILGYLRVRKNSPINETALRLMLDEGFGKGLGQWRNADHGRFVYNLNLLDV